MKTPRYLLPILGLALIPSTASANSGTPLMWASMLHLLIGNAIIGMVEGVLLAWLFKAPWAKSIAILAAANYASAWVGGIPVAGYLPALVDITIENIRYWLVVFFAAAFIVTLVIEFPFVWFALGPGARRLRRTMFASLAVNAVSYLFLAGWYWIASGTTMMTGCQVVPADGMKPPEAYALYYLSKDGGRLMRMVPGEPESGRVVCEVDARRWEDRLVARPRGDSGFDLFIRHGGGGSGTETESLLLESFSDDTAAGRSMAEGAGNGWRATFPWGPVPSMDPKSDWKYRAGFWAVEGLSGENAKAGENVRFCIELPFAFWPVRSATQVAGGYVIAQLGADQIIMIHPESGRIALIARGKGPIVAKPK